MAELDVELGSDQIEAVKSLAHPIMEGVEMHVCGVWLNGGDASPMGGPSEKRWR